MSKDFAFISLIVILIFYVYTLQKEQDIKNEEYNNKLKMFITLNDEYKLQLKKNKCPVNPRCPGCKACGNIEARDMAVVSNPLYPPLDRQSRPLADEYLRYKEAGIFDIPTRNGSDTYRLMGYLINSTNKNDKWNIYGKQRHSGSSHGNFYATQQCNNNTCTKIELTKDILINERLNDFYNLPSTLTFNSPLFGTDPYDVVQLSMADNYNNMYY